jgi:Type VI secretion system/phage-baseplate injector OB domain
MSSPLLFGIYRAVIIDKDDPLNRGRLRVTQPNFLGDAAAIWANALVSDEINRAEVGATVMVMFEDGSYTHPVVIGVLQGSAD